MHRRYQSINWHELEACKKYRYDGWAIKQACALLSDDPKAAPHLHAGAAASATLVNITD